MQSDELAKVLRLLGLKKKRLVSLLPLLEFITWSLLMEDSVVSAQSRRVEIWERWRMRKFEEKKRNQQVRFVKRSQSNKRQDRVRSPKGS